MLFDDDPRDKRKKRFIAEMKKRKCGLLISPLASKLARWEKGEAEPEELFRTAGHAANKGEVLISDFKKRPDVILAGIAMDENRYITTVGEIGIEVRKCRVTEVFSDVVISPVRCDGSGFFRAAAMIVEDAGGEEAIGYGSPLPADPGTAFSTGPGALTVEGIIHLCLDARGAAGAEDQVTKGLLASFALAEGLDAETVAVPGIEPGEDGLSPAVYAAGVIEAVKEHPASSISKVVLTGMEEETVGVFVELLERHDAEND